MRRLLNSAQKMQKLPSVRQYHQDSMGKSLMGSTQVVPPPTEFFNYHYVFDNYPDAVCGFHVAPRDPYVVQQVFAYETWEYTYEGQWWNIGSLFHNIWWFLTPAILYFILYTENQSSVQRRGTRNVSYHTMGGYWHYQMYDQTEKPMDQ